MLWCERHVEMRRQKLLFRVLAIHITRFSVRYVDK